MVALQDYDFQIIPIAGKANQRADALTRRDQDRPTDLKDARLQFQEQPLLKPEHFAKESSAIAPIETEQLEPLTTQLLKANKTSPELSRLRTLFLANPEKMPGYECRQGLLLYKGRLLVGPEGGYRVKLITEAHEQLASGHPGTERTWQLLKPRYYWPRIKGDVKQFVRNCHTCKRSKNKNEKYNGLLKPLPIPFQPWKHIACDFVTHLPLSEGKDAILTVTDRFSKMKHFIPCTDATTARELAKLYLHHVWKYHGFPTSIVSDRGPQFISEFWRELCKLLGIELCLSTPYHPETDGQSENTNKEMEVYLRNYVNYYQDDWVNWLPAAEFAANANTSSSLSVSPFFAAYGYEPRLSFDWIPEQTLEDPIANWNREQAQEKAAKMQGIWEWCRIQL